MEMEMRGRSEGNVRGIGAKQGHRRRRESRSVQAASGLDNTHADVQLLVAELMAPLQLRVTALEEENARLWHRVQRGVQRGVEEGQTSGVGSSATSMEDA
eukprot:6616855-Prymnesium_polylepis.1